MNISWPMIPGRALAAKRIDDPSERERIIREADWNLNGKKPGDHAARVLVSGEGFQSHRLRPRKMVRGGEGSGVHVRRPHRQAP
jgi:alpha-L-fucosidase